MATGWVKDGSHWYYLNPANGKMKTGWHYEDGAWYYLKPGSGQMATGRLWIVWKYYRFADNGTLIR